MPIFSANQEIDIRYGELVQSADVNKKLKDALGENAKISGLVLSHVSGLNCKINAGRMVIQGTSIEENQDITIPVPTNSGNPEKTHYLYATYTHGNEQVCSYELLTSTTVAANYLLIGSVYMPAGATVVTPVNIVSTPPVNGIVALNLMAVQIEIDMTNLELDVGDLIDSVDLLQTTVSSHTASIATLNTNLGTLTTTVGGHTTTLSSHATTLSSHTTSINSQGTTIGSHTTSIATLVAANNTNISAIDALETSVAAIDLDLTAAETAIATKIAFSDVANKVTQQINTINLGGVVNIIGGSTLRTGTGNAAVNGYLYVNKLMAGAAFNDYAEWFERGMDTEAGDIISLLRVSDKEVYVKADRYFNNITAGIHSEEYGYITGGDDEDNVIDRFIPVGLVGRVPVKVKGVVQKGDYIALSDTPGVGISVGKDPLGGYIVGKSIEDDFESGIRRVRCILLPH